MHSNLLIILHYIAGKYNPVHRLEVYGTIELLSRQFVHWVSDVKRIQFMYLRTVSTSRCIWKLTLSRIHYKRIAIINIISATLYLTFLLKCFDEYYTTSNWETWSKMLIENYILWHLTNYGDSRYDAIYSPSRKSVHHNFKHLVFGV